MLDNKTGSDSFVQVGYWYQLDANNMLVRHFFWEWVANGTYHDPFAISTFDTPQVDDFHDFKISLVNGLVKPRIDGDLLPCNQEGSCPGELDYTDFISPAQAVLSGETHRHETYMPGDNALRTTFTNILEEFDGQGWQEHAWTDTFSGCDPLEDGDAKFRLVTFSEFDHFRNWTQPGASC